MATATVAIELAVLDMAGTTVVDDGLVVAAFGQALVSLGIPADDPATPDRLAHVRATMGSSKLEVFRDLLGDDGQARRGVIAFEAAVAEAVVDGQVRAVPGAERAMARLRGAGIQICLTTGFSPATQALLLDALGWSDLVDLTLAPGPGRRGRPHPDLVLAAVLATGTDDVRAVAVVGDTTNDLWSGWRAGAGVVAGVLTGSHGRAELEAAPHTHILASVADLPGVLGLDVAPELGSDR
jgi:phosphoglycolate phosphatase